MKGARIQNSGVRRTPAIKEGVSRWWLKTKNFFVLLNNSDEALNQQLRVIRTKSSSLTQAFS